MSLPIVRLKIVQVWIPLITKVVRGIFMGFVLRVLLRGTLYEAEVLFTALQ